MQKTEFVAYRHDAPKLFRARGIEYDEARATLLVDGERRALESKPLALLHALLRNGGAVASKQALIEAVWGNADYTSAASLANAVSKIRAVLGESGRDVIESVHGSGYRINAVVEVIDAPRQPAMSTSLVVGDLVPGRGDWRLASAMGAPGPQSAWLARQDGTGALRVYTFAESQGAVAGMRQRAEAFRALHRVLGDRDDLVPVEDLQGAKSPFFIATAYGGAGLAEWADAQGGLAAIPLEARLDIVAQAARTLAAAHSAGVLHDGLVPACVLVSPRADGTNCVRLTGFHGAPAARVAGSLGEAEPAPVEQGHAASLYTAPERAAGSATIASDLYGLGVLLYQIVVADLARPLTIGWEDDVADMVLRQDIAGTAAGDPTRRFTSASELAERLATLQLRRAELRERALAQEETARLRAQAERARLRRPWIAAASLSLVVGLVLAVGFGLQALRDRDRARRRTELAQSVNAFLTEDLLGRGDPAHSGKPDETLMQAAAATEGSIDRRLAAEPMEAGAIYLSLARTYDGRSAYDDARRAYIHAASAFGKAGPEGAAPAVIAQLRQAAMEMASGQAGSLPRAIALVAAASPRVAALAPPLRPEVEIWLLRARARLAVIAGDEIGARQEFLEAAGRADAMPDVFDETSRLDLRQDLASTYMRLADWAPAGDILSRLFQRELALNGPCHAETLRVQLRLAEVRAAQGDVAGALTDLDRMQPAIEAVFGPDHRVTLTLVATRADVLSRLGRYDEALAAQMALYRTTSVHDGLHSWTALGTLVNASQTQCRAGHSAPGLAVARSAYDGARDAFGPSHVVTQAAAGNVAFCLILQKQYAQAAELLDHLDARAVAEMLTDPDYPAEIAVMRADIALATGDAERARSMLARAAPVFERPGADRYMRAWARRLVSAATIPPGAPGSHLAPPAH